jgi:hypothetical protein
MRRSALATLATAVVTALACRTLPQTPVHLEGDAASLTALAGTWVGEYWGGADGRGGSLTFALRAGSDSLYGDVTMVDPHGQIVRAADPMETHRLHVSSPQQLRIDFVAVRADSVRGRLEPYVSPGCTGAVVTTFGGRVSDGRLDGRFSTRGGGRELAEGRWEMKRTGDAAR